MSKCTFCTASQDLGLQKAAVFTFSHLFYKKIHTKVDSDSELEKRVSSKNGVRIILVVEAVESTTAE